jgi:hypothetical protein
LPELFNEAVGGWLAFKAAITFLQCQADVNGLSSPIHGNQPLKQGLLRSLMKIADLRDDDL